MTPERLRKVREVFESIAELPPDEREHALCELKKSDTNLFAEVQPIVAALTGNLEFLACPAINPKAAEQPELAGTRLGLYKLVREVGRGGMGTVYEATRIDGAFSKRVAIKIVSVSLFSKHLNERFRQEREILAALEHPGIARILDGGTTWEGRPYLVMEYVSGVRIDHYSRDHRLSVDARLELFTQVCDVVQFAHDHLIVHRDIKPTNILVTPEGGIKLLDFGIAKLLGTQADSEPAVTSASALILTPEYSSPEQVLGKPITVATDVYLLGLLLYELLTGSHPLRSVRKSPRPLHELLRAVCELDPVRPNLKGELPNILLMALRKDPACRYKSVNQFKTDIQNYRTGKPVLAEGDRFSYRLSKYCRRNVYTLAAAALIFISIAASGIVSAVEARRASRRYNDLRSLVTTLLFELHDNIHDLAGSAPARRLVLSKAQQYLEMLSVESSGDIVLQKELASAYEKTGDLLHDALAPGTTDVSSLQSYQRGLKLRQSIAARDKANLRSQSDLAFSLSKVGDGHFFHGETAVALKDYEQALSVQKAVLKREPPIAEMQKVMGYIQNRRCLALAGAGDLARSEEACRASIFYLEQALARIPGDRLVRRTLASTSAGYANLLRHLDRLPESLALLTKATLLLNGLAAEQPNSVEYRRLVAYTQFYLAGTLFAGHDEAGGQSAYASAASSMQALLSIDPSDAKTPLNFGFMLMRMAGDMKKAGNAVGAESAARQALELLRAVAERPGAGPLELNEYANSLLKTEFPSLRQPAKALQLSLSVAQITKEAEPNFMDTLAWAYYLTGDRNAAVKAERKALSLVPPGSVAAQGLRRELEQSLTRFESAFPE